MTKKVLIIGVNGFIGNRLCEVILQTTDWQVIGMDIYTDKLENCLNHERFNFFEADMTKHSDWLEEQVSQADVVLPLAAIATPATYVKEPLRIFELDFEANLAIIRMAVRNKTRLIFPSTSEVYGMCSDDYFNEETSNLVTGPINKERWIYSCSKQLMDRVIYAYGQHEDLDFTLFRPFNWYGPKLDNILEKKKGGSRVLTQFIGNILRGEDISLVDGGSQKRAFCYLDDCIDALVRIIDNKDNATSGRIINIGNPEPEAEFSIRELAETLIELIKTYPEYKEAAEKTKLIDIASAEYYGKGYQDVSVRRPDVQNAKELINWQPSTDFKAGLKRTLDFYLNPEAYDHTEISSQQLVTS